MSKRLSPYKRARREAGQHSSSDLTWTLMLRVTLMLLRFSTLVAAEVDNRLDQGAVRIYRLSLAIVINL